jgi:E3 ubiquitin-protein ligase UBR1
MLRRKLCQLFVGHPGISGLANLAYENKSMEPLLGLDIFVFLAECSLCLVPVLNIDVLHIIQMCYVAEIVKTVLAFILRPQGLAEELNKRGNKVDVNDDSTSEQCSFAHGFFDWIVSTYKKSSSRQVFATSKTGNDFIDRGDAPPEILVAFRSLAAKYALTFLRKIAILLHVQYGVEFPNIGSEYIELSELDRLTALLRLPSVDKIFESFAAGKEGNPLTPLAAGWIAHWNVFRSESRAEDGRPLNLSLAHPAIFELVGLPKYFDLLVEEANRRRCPVTGKDLSDPSICLFCGDIFCSQAVCCTGSGKLGGCNRHVARFVAVI